MPCMSVAYDAMFATAMTHIATETNARANGVAARSTPTRKIVRAAVAVTAVIAAGRKRGRGEPDTGGERGPMNGPAPTSATASGGPPLPRRTPRGDARAAPR